MNITAKDLTKFSTAASAAMLATSQSDAAIQYFAEPIDGPTVLLQGSFVNLDLNNDTLTEFRVKNYSFFSTTTFQTTNYQGLFFSYYPGAVAISNSSFPAYASNLAFGTVIDSALLANKNHQLSLGFKNIDAGIDYNPGANFQFQPNDPNSGYIGWQYSFDGGTTLVYGWMRLSTDIDTGSLVIYDWAFEDTGAPITAGAIPEPSEIGFLIAGAAGLVALRNRRKKLA